MRVLVAPCRRLPSALSILDYNVPAELEDVITEGQLVEIPLGKSRLAGIIIKRQADSGAIAENNLKSILGIPNPFPALSTEQVGFLREISDIYRAPLGAMVSSTLFSFQKKTLAEFKALTREESPVLRKKEVFSEQTAYYSTPNERLATLLPTLNADDGQRLIVTPTIHDARALFNEVSKDCGAVRLFTSDTTSSAHRKLWFELWQKKPLCVIGTRRALMLPWETLHTIIIDAEADRSYQSFESAPRGHVRDLAYILAQHHRAKLLYAGHTPSVTGFELLKNDSVQRIPAFPNPSRPVHVDVAKERQVGLAGLISLELEERLKSTTGPSFLYLNRRGSAQCIMCKDCRHTYRCPTCSDMLTFYTRGNRLSCHTCGHEQKLGLCPSCGGMTVKKFGYGTGTIEEFVREHFPDRPCVRLDSDQPERDVPLAGAGTIIIGTDFAWPLVPWGQLSLYACIDLESSEHVPEWHVSEETWYRLRDTHYRLSPAADFIVQGTREYEKSLLPLLSDPVPWYEKELRQRRLLGYPPSATILKMHLEYPNKNAAEQEVARVYQTLVQLTKGDTRYTIHHPAPMRPFSIAGSFRYAIIAKIREPRITEDLRKLTAELPPAWKISINPAHLLS